MNRSWKDVITCATECASCHKPLAPKDERILSCFTHEAICMSCKKKEEEQPGYEEASRKVIAQCRVEIEMKQSDPEGYCYNHFYSYKC